MGSVIVLGGGVCGLAAGIVLARDGHEVTVIERDPQRPPESVAEAWESWSRTGVRQFRLAHFMQPAGRALLEEMLPDVFEALVSAGALRLDMLAMMPPGLLGEGARAGDERFVTYTARRTSFEQVLASAAEREPGLEVRRGATASELVIEPGSGAAHVSGVRLESSETLSGELVVDAMGRGSPLVRWLARAGIDPVHEEAEDSGFIYYGRYFRSPDGSTPQPFGPLLAPIGSFSVLTLPSDNGTWAVTTVISSGDQALKRMREPELWTAVMKACPLHAHWLEGEPIGGFEAMGGVIDRYRRASAEGRPLLTGIALLGDALACTNPSLGRGMALGLMHVSQLRAVVGEHLGDAAALAQAWDAATEATLTPWYRETVEEDRERLREIEALRSGREPAPASGRPAQLREALGAAALHDAELFRAYLDSRALHAPLGEIFARPGVAERTLRLAHEHEPLRLPGPDREELLALLG